MLLCFRVCTSDESFAVHLTNTVVCPIRMASPRQDSLSSLKHLVSLDLSKNQLTELPGMGGERRRGERRGKKDGTVQQRRGFSGTNDGVCMLIERYVVYGQLCMCAMYTECARKVRAEKCVML